MKVTLAVPYEKNKANDTVDLNDATAKRLIATGRARVADSKASKPDAVTKAVRETVSEARNSVTVASPPAGPNHA